MAVRNVTITLDEETARWARVEAARQDMSVSRFVGNLLRSSMLDQATYEEASRSYRERPARPLKADEDRYPARDAVYDRAGLR